MFEALQWDVDGCRLGELEFRLQPSLEGDEATAMSDSHFRLYKIPRILDSYDSFFASVGPTPFTNVLELGIWDGGSTALWFEALQPQNHVAVDLDTRGDGPYFKRWAAAQGGRVRTRWGVDQASKPALLDLVRSESLEPIDLVIDDASHLYGPTRASFEALFPLVRPGGWYIIEDWAWEHIGEFQQRGHFWAFERSLTPLVSELCELVGSAEDVAPRIVVHKDFAAVARGPASLGPDFTLSSTITRRPGPSAGERIRRRMPDWARPVARTARRIVRPTR